MDILRTVTVDELVEALRAAPRYRSTVVVRAERLTDWASWRSERGAGLQAKPGDWWLRAEPGSHWTVADDIFRRTYRELPDGRFVKDASVRALRVTAAIEIPTLEGTAHAEPGDWVLRGADDELWPVSDEYFRANYRLDSAGS